MVKNSHFQPKCFIVQNNLLWTFFLSNKSYSINLSTHKHYVRTKKPKSLPILYKRNCFVHTNLRAILVEISLLVVAWSVLFNHIWTFSVGQSEVILWCIFFLADIKIGSIYSLPLETLSVKWKLDEKIYFHFKWHSLDGQGVNCP